MTAPPPHLQRELQYLESTAHRRHLIRNLSLFRREDPVERLDRVGQFRHTLGTRTHAFHTLGHRHLHAGLLEALVDDMRELEAEVTLETAEPAPFTGRLLALKRCIGNLLENAVRYGQEAHISIRDTPSQLQIIISDKGPGIPDEELEGLFRPFYRRETSRNRQTGGTGLGLGIARNIARAHGGEVTMRPGTSAGLEALVTLPRDL